MPLILHITTLAHYQAALPRGPYTAPSLATQGFIHFSTPNQLLPIANALFKGQPHLILLCVETTRLTAPLRHENLEGGSELYPHLYGPLNLNAITQTLPFPPNPNGTFSLPSLP